ncbi:MAG: response regulator [Armatimonadota bacterium]
MQVFIVEDHALVREAMAEWLSNQPDIQVVGTAATAEEAVAKLAEVSPDVVLLDVHLPGVSGIQCIPDLVQVRPQAKVVLLTGDTDEAVLFDAITAGASGFILKTAHPDQVLRAMRDAVAGNFALDPSVAGTVARWAALSSRPTKRPGETKLSSREREIAQLAAQGLTNQQIADRLFVSGETVKTHLRNVFRKLGVRDRHELRVWMRGELPEPPP